LARRWRRRACWPWPAGLAWLGLRAHAQAFDLKALMQRLAQRKVGRGALHRRAFVSGIDSPLRASGTLSFAAPDRFARARRCSR
jgi:hypothetical protein